MLRGKRGAYFFVIDAVVASAIIVAALFFIFTSYSSQPERQTTFRAGEDFLNFIYSTKIREYNSFVVQEMVDDDIITNLDKTLADQALEFYFKGQQDLLTNFTNDISSVIVPSYRGLFVYINGTLVYNSTMHKPAQTMNASSLVLSSKRLSFTAVNQTAIYGPVWIEVTVWT